MQSRYKHYSKKLFEINANWTAIPEREGWNHFRISARRRDDKGGLELELMAVCDREIRLWIPRSELRDLNKWVPGWKDPITPD